MAVACSPSPSPTPAIISSDQRDHEKFCRYFFQKSAQIIVRSRLGEKVSSLSQPHSSNAWFNLAIKDISEVAVEAKKAYCGGSSGSHTIEISLKTSEGDSMILETWCVSMNNENRDPNTKLNNVAYNHLGLLLKSVLCVSRVTPAYKFSRRQGPESFVVCYRIHAGDPVSPSLLGQGYQSCFIGQVLTPVGSVSIKVDYRTDMTITPSNASSISSNLMFIKSDNFDLAANNPNINKKSKSSDDSSALTSDESQEAFRLFSSDSPHCIHQPQQTTCSNNTEEDPNEKSMEEPKFRFGAFATNPKNFQYLEEDDNDPLFNFLPQEIDEIKPSKADVSIEEPERCNPPKESCSSFEENKPSEFELFENIFDHPKRDMFEDQLATAVPSKTEFGIFFKDRPNISLLGLDPEDKPLDDIEGQIVNFEKSLEKYNDMIKALDSLTSESEQEG